MENMDINRIKAHFANLDRTLNDRDLSCIYNQYQYEDAQRFKKSLERMLARYQELEQLMIDTGRGDLNATKWVINELNERIKIISERIKAFVDSGMKETKMPKFLEMRLQAAEVIEDIRNIDTTLFNEKDSRIHDQDDLKNAIKTKEHFQRILAITENLIKKIKAENNFDPREIEPWDDVTTMLQRRINRVDYLISQYGVGFDAESLYTVN